MEVKRFTEGQSSPPWNFLPTLDMRSPPRSPVFALNCESLRIRRTPRMFAVRTQMTGSRAAISHIGLSSCVNTVLLLTSAARLAKPRWS